MILDHYVSIETQCRELSKKARARKWVPTWRERALQNENRAHHQRVLGFLNAAWARGAREITRSALNKFTIASFELLERSQEVIREKYKLHDLSVQNNRDELASQNSALLGRVGELTAALTAERTRHTKDLESITNTLNGRKKK